LRLDGEAVQVGALEDDSGVNRSGAKP